MSGAALLPEELSRGQPASGLLGWAERGWLPDWLIRVGIRRLCNRRLDQERLGGVEAAVERKRAMMEQLRHAPVAVLTEAANEQHYELPAEFFRLVLGRRLKYS